MSDYNKNIDENLIAEITKQVLAALGQNEMGAGSASANSANVGSTGSSNATYTHDYAGSFIQEVGPAVSGKYPDEVVVGLAPAFGTRQNETILGIPHQQVLKEVAAGVEEEGLHCRFIKVYETSDVGFIGLRAAKLSGSGIGIGLQSKGTAVIHQRDLYPLTNLELFPQAPMLNLEIFRKIGKNAARYAKGQSPVPIHVGNDCMTRPKFQAKAAILHIKETELVDGGNPVELEVRF